MRDSLDEVVHGVFQNKMKKWGKKSHMGRLKLCELPVCRAKATRNTKRHRPAMFTGLSVGVTCYDEKAFNN